MGNHRLHLNLSVEHHIVIADDVIFVMRLGHVAHVVLRQCYATSYNVVLCCAITLRHLHHVMGEGRACYCVHHVVISCVRQCYLAFSVTVKFQFILKFYILLLASFSLACCISLATFLIF